MIKFVVFIKLYFLSSVTIRQSCELVNVFSVATVAPSLPHSYFCGRGSGVFLTFSHLYRERRRVSISYRALIEILYFRTVVVPAHSPTPSVVGEFSAVFPSRTYCFRTRTQLFLRVKSCRAERKCRTERTRF